jgi:hypothetical protein
MHKVCAIEGWKLKTFVLLVLKVSADMINLGLCPRNPHGDLLITTLSEDHALLSAEDRKNLARRDMSATAPNPIPVTTTKVDPDEAITNWLMPDGMINRLLLLQAVIRIIISCPEKLEILFLTAPAIETTTPGALGIKENTFVVMCVSQRQTVAVVEDKLVIRESKLLSHTPNPAPLTVMSEAAVRAETNAFLIIPLLRVTNIIEECNLATALLSTLNANL